MDNKTTIKELKEKIRQFCELRDWDQYHNAKELTIGIVTEASELLEHFRFKSENQVDAMFQSNSKRQELTE
ncbi:MAG: nucleotide pyrophosphohydrolase, partial [Candidatus Helarchaeota archaeon]